MARLRPLLAGLGLLLLAACGSPPTDPTTALDEAWRYAGEQRSPIFARVDGQLEWTGARGDRLDGRLDLAATDGAGGLGRRAGVAVGRRVDGTLEFDVQFARGIVRHVGRIRGDTIDGSWIEEGGTGIIASGTFRLERLR